MIDPPVEIAGRRAMREAAPGIGAALDDAQIAILTRAVALTFQVPQMPGTRPALVASGSPIDETDVSVLRLMTYSLADAEIARHLGMPVTTLRGRVRRLFGKLGAQSRTQAVAVAYESGILAVGSKGPGGGPVRPPKARSGASDPGAAGEASAAPGGPHAAFALSREQVQVLRLLAGQAGDNQIAFRLDLTMDQVRLRIRALYTATGTSTRTGLVAWARRSGLLAVAVQR